MSASSTAKQDATLHLPRILCLHGGGTNARIFRAQCRAIRAQLKAAFRLVFAQGPFPSQAGPDVLSAYDQWGPFRRWLRWLPEHPDMNPEQLVRELDASLEEAMRLDDEVGGTGEWVGLLGFSQGAKVCASLLYRQQIRNRQQGHLQGTAVGQAGRFASARFRFGILLAGRAPLISLAPDIALCPPLPAASQITDVRGWVRPVHENGGHVLRIPTLHIHGRRDPGLELHRQLYEEFCDADTSRLVEWDGDHSLPLKPRDVALVVQQIRELAQDTGLHIQGGDLLQFAVLGFQR